MAVCTNEVTESAAKKFLEQFSLTTRQIWDKPPKGFKSKDISPWGFGRRLSFVTRPILKVDENDDPLLLVAPDALRNGFIFILNGSYDGRLDQSFFHSKAMKNDWWGKAGEDHSFNAKVASHLSDAGWETRENIEMTELLNSKTELNYGDVDVLAWKPDRDEVLIIECKDLSPARNYSEIAALLSNFQGIDIDGKPDRLKKHLIRVNIVKSNLDHACRYSG